MNIRKLINWKLYFMLLVASILSIAAVIPYAFTVQAELLKTAPVPLPVLAILSLVQSSILFAITLFFGLKMAKSLGLRLPILESWLAKEKLPEKLLSKVLFAVLLGLFVGAAILAIDPLFTSLGVQIAVGKGSLPGLWESLLASFYGGIGEEILLRLFFMTFIVWLLSKIFRTGAGTIKNNSLMWTAIIAAAIIFGLGHLPITASITALTPLVVLRAIVLNGIGGVVFGWLYWKKGLEFAMIAHFSTDIVIHVLTTL